MATGRVLKNLLLMSALAGALLIAAPTQARDRYLGDDHGHHRDHGDRHDGHGWGGRDRDNHRGHGRPYYGHGWGHRPHGYYYAPPRRYYPSHHYHYRGCGHDGYYRNGLVEFLVDYSRYDD